MAFNPEAANCLLPIFLIVSVLMTGLGVWLWRKTQSFLAIAKETTGEIVGSQHGRTMGGTGKSTRYALVHFVTDTGQEVEYESMVGLPWAGKNTGEQVPVLYNPDNPEEARINSFIELKLPWLIFLLTGLLMLCAWPVALGFYLVQ